MTTNTSYLYEIDFEVPIQYQNSFQSIFSYIKKKKQIKKSRKLDIDSLLKKCKGKFFKAMHEAICLCVNLRVERIPQEFITDVTIESNKEILNTKILDIYRSYNLLPPLSEIFEKKLVRRGMDEFLKEIAYSNYKELYEVYLTSERYKKDIKILETREGYILYQFVAKNFIRYYLYGKAHIQRKKENTKGKLGKKDVNRKKIVFVVNQFND